VAADVGVVTPYSAQAALLREMLQVTCKEGREPYSREFGKGK
jgi:hypothetical protein